MEPLTITISEAQTVSKLSQKITEALKTNPKIINRIFFCVGLSFLATFAYLMCLPYLFQIQELWWPLWESWLRVGPSILFIGILLCWFCKSWWLRTGVVYGLFVFLMFFGYGMYCMHGVWKSHPTELLPLSAQPEYLQHTIQRLETENHCCGVFNSSDWAKHVPQSCVCKENVSNCTDVNGQMLFSAPCEPHVVTFLQDFAAKARHILCVFVATLVLGLFLLLLQIWEVTRHPERLEF